MNIIKGNGGQLDLRLLHPMNFAEMTMVSDHIYDIYFAFGHFYKFRYAIWRWHKTGVGQVSTETAILNIINNECGNAFIIGHNISTNSSKKEIIIEFTPNQINEIEQVMISLDDRIAEGIRK